MRLEQFVDSLGGVLYFCTVSRAENHEWPHTGKTRMARMARACRGCEHWGGDVPGTASDYCTRAGSNPVQWNTASGGVFWVRAVGADDEGPTRKLVVASVFEEWFPDDEWRAEQSDA